jgi:phosphatidylglycerophosphate synthase
MAIDDAQAWLLVIDAPLAAPLAAPLTAPLTAAKPKGDAARDASTRVLGLSVVLRLALTAQAAGAQGIALADGPALRNVRELLVDPRLRLRVIDELDRPSWLEFRPKTPSVRVPANLVVHRSTFAALRERGHSGQIVISPGDPTLATIRAALGPFGFDPIVVSDRASERAARDALLRSLRKPQDGWTSTHLNRKISLSFTRWLVSTPLKPNQVSVGILGIGLFGAWLASRGTYATMLAGALLFQAQSVLDGCDGEMSRLTFRGSHAGEWLDTIGDDVTNYGFFAGAAWGLYASTGRWVYLALGALTVACGLLGSGLEYRYLIRIGSGDLLKYPLGIGKAPGPSGESNQAKSTWGRALDAISPLFKRDTFVLLTLLGAALGWLGPFLAVFAAGAIGVLVTVIKAELRMGRERKGAPTAARVDPVLPRD